MSSLSRDDSETETRRAVSARGGLLGQIGVRDGVGDAGRLLGAVAGDRDVDHIGPLGAADAKVALQRVQGQESRIVIPARLIDPDGGQQAASQKAERRRPAGELRVLVELLLRDDATQHVLGGEHPDLAFDLNDRRIVGLIAGRQFVLDHAQIGGIDQKLGGRGVLRPGAQREQRYRNEHSSRCEHDHALAPPERGQQLAEIDCPARDRLDRPYCFDPPDHRLEHSGLAFAFGRGDASALAGRLARMRRQVTHHRDILRAPTSPVQALFGMIC